MVGFLFIQALYLRVATHSGWLKTPDRGQKEACNQERKILSNSPTVGCTPHPRLLERMLSSGSNYRFRRKWVSAPFGKSKGRTPYKAHTLCVSLLNLLLLLIRSRRSVVSSSSFLIRHRRRRAGTKDYISNV